LRSAQSSTATIPKSPAVSTGLVFIDLKVIGRRTRFETKLKTHSVDVALLRKRRAILDAIAVELGQYVLKTESIKAKVH